MAPVPSVHTARSRALVVAALLLFLSYGFFLQGGGWNQAVRMDLTWALVEQGGVVIDDYVANTGDMASFEGHHYSAKAPGTSLLAVPIHASLLGVRAALGLDLFSAEARAASGHLATWLLGGGSTALLAWLAALAAGRWFGASERQRLFVLLTLGLGTMAFPFATVLMGHSLAAVAGLGALLLVRPGTERVASPGWAGLLAGCAVALEYPAIIFLPVALALLLHRQRSLPAALRFCAAALPPLLVVGLYHQLCFGSPFTTGYAYHADMFRYPEQEVFLGLYSLPRPDRLWGLTFGAKRGLFSLYPACLLGLAGGVMLWRRGRGRPVLVASVVVLCWFLLLNASYPNWEAGYCSGPRYLLPALPLLMIPAGITLKARLRLGATAVASISTLLATAITLVNPLGPFQVDSLLGQYVFPALAQGRVGENFFQWWPQWRPETQEQAVEAATNLGELMGLTGLASALPLAALWIVGGLLLARLLQARRASVGDGSKVF